MLKAAVLTSFGHCKVISIEAAVSIQALLKILQMSHQNTCVGVSFTATGLFLYPMKARGFLIISGGTEKDQWHEMGLSDSNSRYLLLGSFLYI